MNILLIFLGYALGNINPAYIIGKIKNTDIKKVGSANPGASNITMTFGWKFGIITGLIDISKAFIPVLIIKLLGYNDFELLTLGTSVIIGHIFPVVFRFKGGKGTASFVGMTLAINPLLGFMMGGLIIITTIITDYIALGTIVMMIGWVIATYFLYDTPFFILSLLVPLISVYKHIPNVKKIILKEESGLRATFQKK